MAVDFDGEGVDRVDIGHTPGRQEDGIECHVCDSGVNQVCGVDRYLGL
jgi:hypothetical protein